MQNQTLAPSLDVSQPVSRSYATNIYDLLKSQAAKHADAVAIAAPGRADLSYAHLLRQAESTTRALRSRGLRRNDRVAVVLPNGPEMAVAFVSLSAGATCAPLNPAYRAPEFEFYLSDLNAKALIIEANMDSPAREVARKLHIPVIELTPRRDLEAGTFEFGGSGVAPAEACDFAEASDISLVLHTSGTTSRPKIVPLTQANVTTSGRNIAATLQLSEMHRCLNVMPLFHIHGLMGALISSLTAGANVVCTPGFDAEKFFEWLDTCHPNWYTAVPTIHQAVLARAAANKDIIARRPLRLIRSSSASLPHRVMTDLELVFGTQVIEAYGMTEASHQMTSNPLAPLPRRGGSVGIPAGPDVSIMDDDGNLLPAGELGEVVIRGANVTLGYENNATANEKSFTNGWFRTGDQGRFDSDGYLSLTGRLKEIINRGGEKIAPREVDEVLLQHPAVAQAVAFAVPHPTLGEDVAAALVLKEKGAATERELREFAAARLVDFKVPKQVLIIDEIPKGPTGKLQRVGLAEKLADKLALAQQDNFTAPTTSVEKQLSDIWKDVLKVDQVGVNANFHALGGDSLSLAVMLIEVEGRFKTKIPVDRFLAAPTIKTIIECLEPTQTSASEPTAHRVSHSRWPTTSLLAGVKNRLLQIAALYVPGYKSTRIWLHRLRGVSIGHNVSIGLSALIETEYPQLVFLGDNVSIGMRAVIIAHLRDSTPYARATNLHTVRIEDNAYIGPGVIILPNVTIGTGAVVTAGSVVSRSIPEHTLAQGNPAVPIAHCGVSLGGGVSYEEFLRHLKPIQLS